MKKQLPIAMSNRHLHLSQQDVDTLFGSGYELTKAKDLGQPGQYACEEKIDIEGPRGTIKGIRVLGPVRKQSQIELSVGDARGVGVESFIRRSGDLAGTPGVKMIGPKGQVELKEGVIVAARHVHMSEEDGERLGVKNLDILRIKVEGERGLIFENVLARVAPNFVLEMHVDIEEGNAAGIKNYQMVEIID